MASIENDQSIHKLYNTIIHTKPLSSEYRKEVVFLFYAGNLSVAAGKRCNTYVLLSIISVGYKIRS